MSFQVKKLLFGVFIHLQQLRFGAASTIFLHTMEARNRLLQPGKSVIVLELTSSLMYG
jgi:hypothetical protein